jgi:Rieske Fe-S protein
MHRRTVFLWISRVIALACAAVVAVPGVSYVIAPLLRRRESQAVVRRVARLNDLPAGVPAQFAITGSRQDAWMQFPQQTIGRVWLVRRTDDSTPPEQAQVDAFTAVCPHLGCVIQFDASTGDFVCPCHQAVFDVRGQARGNLELGRINPAPRGMDLLESRLVPGASSEEWWVEVQYEEFEQGTASKVRKA